MALFNPFLFFSKEWEIHSSFFSIALIYFICYNLEKGRLRMIYINPNWTYKEVIEHIKDYKAEYQGVLSAFNMWQTKEWANYIKTTRNKFYSLNLMEWQIEFLWKYMNGYLDIHKLKLSAKRYK